VFEFDFLTLLNQAKIYAYMMNYIAQTSKSEFELLAEELLMSDSVIKVF